MILKNTHHVHVFRTIYIFASEKVQEHDVSRLVDSMGNRLNNRNKCKNYVHISGTLHETRHRCIRSAVAWHATTVLVVKRLDHLLGKNNANSNRCLTEGGNPEIVTYMNMSPQVLEESTYPWILSWRKTTAVRYVPYIFSK